MKRKSTIFLILAIIFIIGFMALSLNYGFVNYSLKKPIEKHNGEIIGLSEEQAELKIKESDEWKSIQSWRCQKDKPYWIVEGKCEMAPECLGFYTKGECENALKRNGKIERKPDTVAKIKPTQCAELSWKSIESAKEYFESKGILIYDFFKITEDIAVCEACDCPDYDTYYFLISSVDLTLALENYLEKTSCRSEFEEEMCKATKGIFVNNVCNCP